MLFLGGASGPEIKYQDAPKLTPSMRTALHDLKLLHLTVIYPGDRDYHLAERIDVVPFAQAIANPALITARADAVR